MIAVVSHDAGGAEILSSWVRRCREDYCLCLEGPAKDIFERKLGACHSVSLGQAIAQSDWVLCGTSWDGKRERLAIVQAKAAGKKVVAFLDHWVNYPKRFEFNGTNIFPDEIWVGDEDAQKKVRTVFPEIPVILKPNPYFADIQMEFEKLEPLQHDAEKCSILYVCEPISLDATPKPGEEVCPGYSEEEALAYFLKNIDALRCNVGRVKIRPHPRERMNKYDWAAQEQPLLIQVGKDKTLIEDIAEADVVVGCETMAMMVALLANRRVISSIPPGGRHCLLPSAKIEHLQMLVRQHKGLVNA